MIQVSVTDWLASLKMDDEEGYVSKFENAGYSRPEDVEHLKDITEEELEFVIGVVKPGMHYIAMCMLQGLLILAGHKKRLMQAITMLKMKSEVMHMLESFLDKQRMQNTETTLKHLRVEEIEGIENDFWNNLIASTLCPIPGDKQEQMS